MNKSMNKKLLAIAVSAAVMAPVASQAADVTVYGRINNALNIQSVDGGASTTDISSISSRFGIKASSDLGNGLTASAQYEFSTNTDKELDNIADLRVGTVGLSGGFGSVTVGNQWSAYYNTVGTHMDPMYTVGYYIYSSFVGAPYRASNTIKYANSFGPLSLQLDVRVNGSEEDGKVAEKINGDGVGIGLSFAASDSLTLAVALDSENGAAGADDTDRTGVAAKWASGGFFLMAGWQENETGSASVDEISVYGGTAIGESASITIGYHDAGNNAGATADQFVLGVYHNMGGGMRLFYEGTAVSYDHSEKNDFARHVLGMRYDF